jgi:hypothetical protein
MRFGPKYKSLSPYISVYNTIKAFFGFILSLFSDETGGVPHEGLQEEDKRRLSYLQTTDCSLLLPRQAMSGE